MAGPEDLPPELWKDILAYLDKVPQGLDGQSGLPEAASDVTLKNLSLVSKHLRLNSLALLFKYMQLELYYSERQIKDGQEATLTNCLNFIEQTGLRSHISRISFRAILDQKYIGIPDKRSANWLTEQKDWHIHRQTARIFEVVNPQTFRLCVYCEWKHTRRLLNALHLYQDVSSTTEPHMKSDILLHQKDWNEIELLDVSLDQASPIYYSMLEFNRRTPSLLKPLILGPYRASFGSYRPSRVEILPESTTKLGFPGLLAHLTTFTFLSFDMPPYGTDSNAVDGFNAVAAFLDMNCPNLQHLKVRLRPQKALDYYPDPTYTKFTGAILAKPDLKTPKTFFGMDIRLISNVHAQSHCQSQLGKELVGWESTGLGEFHSVV